ncbi:hypothetical protein M2168_005603 [Streptomyces sp. CZ24]|uniref:hypothetical protein n=1 Tax=Streptomyces sp. WAC00276 TaxID=2933778 RepID=UPI001163DFFE|nr:MULTISPECIES: hypothetical protein [unclassified Streptomyces]MCK2144697.1 hypothetical protein [Streptomyces sp. WAC00276]MDH6192571.1 hypothetical protein [Streptomyces sp. CZ24]QDD61716.1 hypothetical protein FE156_27530 [Streptomyces albidoflavus]
MTTTHPTPRQLLRREIAGTLGLLASADDLAAMRRYRTFLFEDHPTYLRQAEALLRSLAAQGRTTSVVLFDPAEFARFCAQEGLDPDTTDSRARYTAEAAALGPCILHEGEPLPELLRSLVAESLRQTTWEYASDLLDELGDCPRCARPLAHHAQRRAAHLLGAALDTTAPGHHQLVCSLTTAGRTLLAALHADTSTAGEALLDHEETADFTTLLACALALPAPAGLVMRSRVKGEPEEVRGWRLRAGRAQPLTAGEVFDAYCTDPVTGEPVAPEPGVEYRAGTPLDDDHGPDTCH